MREEAASEIAIGAVLVDLGSGSGMAKGKGRATEDEQTEGEVGSYDVVKILGEGAFSRVVQGRKRSSGSEGGGEIVAIKMIATAAVDGNERMKSSVGREMGVLKVRHSPSCLSLARSELTFPDLSAYISPFDRLLTLLVLNATSHGPRARMRRRRRAL